LAEIADAQAEAAAAYATELMRITESMVESFGAFSTLMETPRFGEDDWTSEVRAQVAVWDSLHEEALALDPPPVLAETQALLVEALDLYGEAGDDFVTAFEMRDSAVADQAVSKVAAADELFRQVLEELDRVRGEQGG
jgi:hypothetical protein